MNAARGRGTGIALLALALVVLGLLSLGAGAREGLQSVTSNAPEGRRAAFLLLTELGFAPELWTQQPGALAEVDASRTQVWLADAPAGFREAPDAPDVADATDTAPEPTDPPVPGSEPGTQPEPARPDPLDLARERGPGGMARYREFVERGGTLVLPATERGVAFATQGLGLAADGLPAWESDAAWELYEDVLGNVLELGLDSEHSGNSPRVLLADMRHAAAEYRLGEGRCVLIAAGDYFDNANLGEADNALLLVRLLEWHGGPGAGRVLFDEHALGLGAERGALSLALGSRGLLLTLNLALAVLLACWRLAWVREFPRDPAPLESVSPLARARSLAGSLRSAGRFEALADLLRAGDGRSASVATDSGRSPRSLAQLVALDRKLRDRAQAELTADQANTRPTHASVDAPKT